MGEEFEAGICGGNYNNSNSNYWWINNNNNNNMMMMNSATTRSVFPLMISSSPCSVLAANTADLPGGGMIGYSSWQSDTVDLKAPMSNTTSSCSDISLGFLDATTATATKPLLQAAEAEAAVDNHNHHNNGSILMDSSSLDMNMIMAWNNSLFGNNSSSQSQDQKREMSTKNNQDLCGGGGGDFSSVGSYEYPCVNNSSSASSKLIQSLYEIPHPQPQSLFTNPSASMAYSSISTPNNNYGPISNSSTDQFTTTTTTTSSSSSPSSWSRPSNNNNNNNSSFLKSNGGGLHFSNCAPFWNASVETPHVFAPSISDKPNFTSSLISKPKREEASDYAKKASSEPAIKKQRIETPSPLPTFKVRKEKLGDRITALQQLVSPFGKTDTASVLHEAIVYIKFLHDQVSVLSTPYMKNGVPIQHFQQGCGVKDSSEGRKQDLRSRGLCLVPISSTFPITNETPVDFWTPSFGGTLLR